MDFLSRTLTSDSGATILVGAAAGALSFGLKNLSRKDSLGGEDGILAASTGAGAAVSTGFDTSASVSFGSSPIGAMTGGVSETMSRLVISASFFSASFFLSKKPKKL